ncbi:MAG: ATP-binding cassette domain-containing protein [Pseudomonadota bacterium]
MQTSETAILAQGVSHWFGKGALRQQVLFDLQLEIAKGEVVFLMGPSGCGKTTFLTLIGALRSVMQGSIALFGEELFGASAAQQVLTRRKIGFVFQNHNLHRSLTLLGNVMMGLEAKGLNRLPDAKTRCLAMLERVGLQEHAHKRQAQISSGQRQRVAVARALVSDPPLVLADEPTAALDRKTGHDVVALMRQIAEERGVTVLMVTHDNRVLDLADRIVEMEDGRIVEATADPPIDSRSLHSMERIESE